MPTARTVRVFTAGTVAAGRTGSVRAMESRRIAVAEGVALHALVAATRPDGPALDDVGFVLVHGLASNARMWTGVAGHLVGAGHPVAAVDLRGHGLSDRPDQGYGVREVAADVARVITTLGWDRPVVAGQSWGGNVVLQLAADHPDLVRGVAGVDGGDIELAGRFPDWEACAEALAPPVVDGLTASDFEARFRARHPDWPESGIAGFLANLAVDDDGFVQPRLPRHLHMEIVRGLWEHRPSVDYATLERPVLLLMADEPDDDAPRRQRKREQAERAAAALVRSRLCWVAGDHDLHAQQPRLVADALLGAVTEGFFA